MENIRFYQPPSQDSSQKRRNQAIHASSLLAYKASFTSAPRNTEPDLAPDSSNMPQRSSEYETAPSNQLEQSMPFEQTSSEYSRSQSSELTCDAGNDENFAGSHRSLDQGSIGVYTIKDQLNGHPDLGTTGQALSPSPDDQHRGSSAHKPVSDLDAQHEIPETQQTPPGYPSIYDRSGVKMSHPGARPTEHHRFPSAQDPFSGEAGRSDVMIDATSHDNQSARSQSQMPECVSNDHRCDGALAPPLSAVVEDRSDLGSATSSLGMPHKSCVDAALPTSDGVGNQPWNMRISPAIMPTDSPTSARRGPDITIHPLERTDSCILTAIAGSLSEAEQLSKSPDAWQIHGPKLPSDCLTIIVIKPLRDDLWLLLAKISSLARSHFDPSDHGDEAARHHTRTKRKRSSFRVMTSDDDSEWAEDHAEEQGAKRKRTKQPIACGARRLKRGDWEEWEDQLLAELKENGAPWSSILPEFPRRRKTQLQSRWQSKLKRLISSAPQGQ